MSEGITEITPPAESGPPPNTREPLVDPEVRNVEGKALYLQIENMVTGWPEWQKAVLDRVKTRGTFPPHERLFFTRGSKQIMLTSLGGAESLTNGYHSLKIRDLSNKQPLSDDEIHLMETGWSEPEGFFDQQVGVSHHSPIREPWEIRYQDANVYDDQTLKGRKLPVENTQTAIDSAKKLLGDLARA